MPKRAFRRFHHGRQARATGPTSPQPTAGAVPPESHRPRWPRWSRWLIGIGLVLLLAAGTGLIGLRTLSHRYDRSVARELLLDTDARQGRSTITGPLNYLLIGTDQRSSTSTGDQRSDTIMIAHLPAGLDRVYLVSIPRDLLVPIPAAPGGSYPGGTDKINAAFQHGGGGKAGAQLLSATLTQLTGVRFDGAALINFAGFRQVIDLLGGVHICVDAEFRSVHTGTLFTPGCREMSGAQALDYARQRYGLPGGDYDRQRHQQQLLRAILDRATATRLITDPVRLDHLIRAIGASFTVDTNGTPLEDLIFALRGIRTDALLGIQVPSHPELIGEVSYVLLDGAAADLFGALGQAEVAPWAEANPNWVSHL